MIWGESKLKRLIDDAVYYSFNEAIGFPDAALHDQPLTGLWQGVQSSFPGIFPFSAGRAAMALS